MRLAPPLIMPGKQLLTPFLGIALGIMALFNPAAAAEVVLKWQDNSYDEDGFIVEQKLQGDEWMQIATLPANTTEITLSDVDSPGETAFRIRAFNAFGTSEPSNSSLEPPSFTVHPQSKRVASETNVVFSVEVTGTAPITFRWEYNGVPLSDSSQLQGSSTPTLNLIAVDRADDGRYQVVASGPAGSTRSDPAYLEVDPPPVITKQPTSVAAPVGKLNIALTVDAEGRHPMRFQWFKNGVLLSDARMKFLIINKVKASDFGIYTVEVSDANGTTLSQPAELSPSEP